ncbi:uncharacterized protein LOC117106242 isoform X2 [Anneissia japonica]|uniref:uncharacterized protein LOC117106242 isoform X2 n=1 Tax=Anneissia japonica TaxID=1529436 RepID=UPI0014256025|nr:uncharacterized protein LOC117106242 isoform X2 [Anneissia japonica]
MESMLTHKEAIQAWHEGVTAFDCGNNEKALEILLQIPQNSTTARILYNIGHIYLILNQYAEAAKNFEAAFEKDVHLAAAFYQCGVALYQDNKFNNARKMFEKSKECLRESQYIDYKALGMTCRLYKCEILLNLSIAVAAMTKDPEWALDILTEADKCQREKNHIQVIQSAKIKLQDGLIPTIFSLPQKEIFRPPKDKIENLSKKDYLGQATVVHAVPGSSIKKLSKPKEEKILDLPSPGQKRHSLQPPTRTAPAPNTFKPINTLNHRVSPTPPNRLPPSPTSPFSRPHSNSPRRISTPSPTPPCRPPPSASGLSNSNVDRLTPSPTPPMRLPPSVPDSNRGRPSPSSSPPPKFFPQSHERSNSGGKGPPIRPPPVSPSKLSTGDSSHSSSVDSRGPSPNKLSHKDTIVIWHEAMLIYQTGNVSEALDKLLSIPEPTAKILFNIGSMQLLTNDVVNATKTFEAAVEKDEHMAIGFFQHGIALARQSEYQLAWDAFDKARRALRKNDSIDYKQIGLPYKLYECEVLNNQSLMYMYLGDQELAKKVLELALKKKAEVRHSKIDAAMDKLKASSVFDLFTLPKDAVFKPPASKVENIKKVDYLGQKKVVAKFEVTSQSVSRLTSRKEN